MTETLVMTAILVFKYFRVCIHLERHIIEGVFKFKCLGV